MTWTSMLHQKIEICALLSSDRRLLQSDRLQLRALPPHSTCKCHPPVGAASINSEYIELVHKHSILDESDRVQLSGLNRHSTCKCHPPVGANSINLECIELVHKHSTMAEDSDFFYPTSIVFTLKNKKHVKSERYRFSNIAN
ncbi:hypothetical protein CDAR_367511 [Caerostris darwini]|uniref:Uncharacterized protein n=1 Tax=Caerostris darwini TaxID=1538125 RepID=A0AAV4Q488_9ARAC|nr:hypothetical protein CDAR_367511 [Caerostris darwini]